MTRVGRMAWPPGRRHKYGIADKLERTYNGVVYHSKREMLHGRVLDQMRHSLNDHMRVVEIERQVRIPLEWHGVRVATYVLDFRVYFADGHDELHEVKGVWTPIAKLKARMFRAQYPQATIKEIR